MAPTTPKKRGRVSEDGDAGDTAPEECLDPSGRDTIRICLRHVLNPDAPRRMDQAFRMVLDSAMSEQADEVSENPEESTASSVEDHERGFRRKGC